MASVAQATSQQMKASCESSFVAYLKMLGVVMASSLHY